ncbi:hypothetical protein [Agitococcus lubricus]|uniref:hypothetical protein n=1 Tax=Agitococcus lubricus TaxID=1077255 RepID=UPI00147540FF|nr:hypothetical protein [Agitococcus lubricus]
MIDDAAFRELNELRMLRNKAVHSHPTLEEVAIVEEDVQRLNQLVDEIEKKLT